MVETSRGTIAFETTSGSTFTVEVRIIFSSEKKNEIKTQDSIGTCWIYFKTCKTSSRSYGRRESSLLCYFCNIEILSSIFLII